MGVRKNQIKMLHGCASLIPKYKENTHVLEFGVWKGYTLDLIAKIYDGDLFGFDSFKGIPEDWWGKDGGLIKRAGHFAYNFDSSPLLKKLTSPGRGPKATIYKGFFEYSIPESLNDHNVPISFLHIDCDLYSSTKTVLDGLANRICDGTIILFDDWFYGRSKYNDDHGARAFAEWTLEYSIEFKFLDIIGPVWRSTDNVGSKCYDVEQKAVQIIKNPHSKLKLI